MNKKGIIITCMVAIIVGGGYSIYHSTNTPTMSDYKDTEVHVHSDFLVVLNDEIFDFTDDKYQSDTITSLRHPDFHLHDNEDEVMHRHEVELTLGTFFESLGFTLTSDCFITDTNEQFCANEDKSLLIYVNETIIENPYEYINQEEDQILIYYGDPNSPKISEYQSLVTDRSCIYSGTCPERGIAPPESCGLTCEL